MTPVCELRSVTKAYDAHVVVDHLDLEVRVGEMLAIVGPSGSGKSTLLNIMGILDKPTEGDVRLFGSPAPRFGSRRHTMLLRWKIGYLFQNYALIESETVDYNLAVAARYLPVDRAARRAKLDEALHKVGLPGMGSRKVFSLSGGEQQRVAVARLLVKPCELVLADEPTGSLDTSNRDTITELLTHLNNAGKTVVVVTHDSHVATACDRQYRL